MQELTRERDDLRSELSKHGSEERQRKTRLVADPLQEVTLGDTLAGATDGSNRGDTSSLMETLIDRADAECSVRSNHRVNPM